MTHKGEIARSRLRSEWPHHVALPAEKVRGLENSEIVRGDAAALSAAPLTYYVRRDRLNYVVFCFAEREDAGGHTAAPLEGCHPRAESTTDSSPDYSSTVDNLRRL
jgi:hypothetical protein